MVINTDSPVLTPLLQKFAKDPSGTVIETFPVQLHAHADSFWRRLIPNSIAAYLCRKVSRKTKMLTDLKHNNEMKPSPSPPQESVDDPPDTSLLLSEAKKHVETGQIVPVVAKSFLPTQYDQAFRHVSNLTRSALSRAHVGKSVVVFKIN